MHSFGAWSEDPERLYMANRSTVLASVCMFAFGRYVVQLSLSTLKPSRLHLAV